MLNNHLVVILEFVIWLYCSRRNVLLEDATCKLLFLLITRTNQNWSSCMGYLQGVGSEGEITILASVTVSIQYLLVNF